MTTDFNLDELVKKLTFTYRGKDYEIGDIPSRNYLTLITHLRQLAGDGGKDEKVSPEEALERQQKLLDDMKRVIAAIAVPEIPEEDLELMGAGQIIHLGNKIIEHVTGPVAPEEGNENPTNADEAKPKRQRGKTATSGT